MAGHLNANLLEPEGTPRGEAIAENFAAAGIEYMGLHLLPQHKPWLQDMCKWSMWRDGQEVRSQTDYILGIDHRMFQYVAVRDSQHHSYH